MTKHIKPCPECRGSGIVAYERAVPHSPSRDIGYIEEYDGPCENCSGTGEIVDDEYEEGLGDWLYHKLKDEEMDHG